MDNATVVSSDVNVQKGTGYNGTFSTTLTITKQVTRDNGHISCRSNGLGLYSATGLFVLYMSYGKFFSNSFKKIE